LLPLEARPLANFILQPGHLLLAILGDAVNDEQRQVIEYLRTENQVLKEKLGKKRIMLDEDQRRRLAVKGKVLGRKTTFTSFACNSCE
jgi:putative transposase